MEEQLLKSLGNLEKRIQLLHEIVSQTDPDLDNQLNTALWLVTTLLEMNTGIISNVEGDTYTIEYCYSKENELQPNQQYELGNTYGSITVQNDAIITIDYMRESHWNRHPCYSIFSLESYIGVPLRIDGELYGTLSFSSSSPKKDGFIPLDSNLVSLMADWVGSILKRKQIEHELKEREALYKLISTNSADMVCLHKPDGTYQFVSPSVKNILGYTPEELIGTNPYDLFHPGDLLKIQEESDQKSLENDLAKNFEYRIRRKDGEYIWFDTASKSITNEQGEVVKLQTTSREITDKKKVSILFEKSQQMANVGGWEYDLKTGELFWTDEVYRIHEVPIGSKVFVEEGIDFYPGKAKNTIRQALNYTIETGKKYDVSLPFVSAKGNHKWVRAIGKALFDDEKAYMIRGTFQDITEQMKLKDLFIQAQKMAHVGGWEYHINSDDLFWTEEVYHIHELPPGSPIDIGQALSFYPPKARPVIQHKIQECLDDNISWDVELPIVTANRTKKWVRAKGHAEYVEGKAVKLIGTFQDITRQKENKEKIKQQNTQLVHLSQTRDKLYSIIAHDLKGAFNGINGMLGLIEEELEDQNNESVMYKLNLAQTSSQNASKIFQNLLDWILIQQDQLKPSTKDADIVELVKKNIKVMTSAAANKEIEIITEFETDVMPVKADPEMLGTVFRNLISNAIKFSNPKNRVVIGIYNHEGNIIIAVKDYGIGMPESVKESLFTVDSRPQRKGTSKEKGNGLGLLLCKELIKLHHGTIEVESEEHKGTEFRIRLPQHNYATRN
ncbi:MAG: PAS domain S-box protein [Balneolaceae bacterium]|nr:PAS domain S-box protein [Balneolaceae bacterium]